MKSLGKIYLGFIILIFSLTLLTLFSPSLINVENENSSSFNKISNIALGLTDKKVIDQLNYNSNQLKTVPLYVKQKQNQENSSLKEKRLVFVGDIMLSRAVDKVMEQKGDFNFPFRYVKEFLNSADLTFANLEGPISDQGQELGHLYSFRADPQVISGLKEAGFDILSLANNHLYDWGPDALLDTISRLNNYNIQTVGAGYDQNQAYRPIILDIDNYKIAFLAASDIPPKNAAATQEKPGIAWLSSTLIEQEIMNIKNQVDLIVLSLHSGNEYLQLASDKQKTLYRQFIDAGADLIIGHHPHVIQEVENYNHGFIFYSLGNFIFDQNWSDSTSQGQAIEVILNQGKISQVNIFKVEISKKTFQPKILLETKKLFYSGI